MPASKTAYMHASTQMVSIAKTLTRTELLMVLSAVISIKHDYNEQKILSDLRLLEAMVRTACINCHKARKAGH